MSQTGKPRLVTSGGLIGEFKLEHGPLLFHFHSFSVLASEEGVVLVLTSKQRECVKNMVGDQDRIVQTWGDELTDEKHKRLADESMVWVPKDKVP